MKRITFLIENVSNVGTEKKPHVVKTFVQHSVPYSETNFAIAQAEAYNGEVTVEDAPDAPDAPDGPGSVSSAEQAVWDKMAGAYREGVKEA